MPSSFKGYRTQKGNVGFRSSTQHTNARHEPTPPQSIAEKNAHVIRGRLYAVVISHRLLKLVTISLRHNTSRGQSAQSCSQQMTISQSFGLC